MTIRSPGGAAVEVSFDATKRKLSAKIVGEGENASVILYLVRVARVLQGQAMIST